MNQVPDSREPLDRAAVARIVARAVEIDATYGERGSLSVPALVEAAGEVGVSADAVHHAVALDRLEQANPVANRRVDRLVGPAEVVHEQQVPMMADELLARIEARLAGSHHLRRLERLPGMSVWEGRSDLAASVQLAVRRMFGEGRLGNARRLVVAVEQLPAADDGRVSSVARLTVHRHVARSGALIASSAAGAAGLGAGAVGAVLVAPIAWTLALPGAAAGAAISWQSRSKARSIENDLKVLLDRVVHDSPAPALSERVMRRLAPRRA